jgi:hypothetical protein
LDEGLLLLTVAEVTVADGVRQGGHQDEFLAPSLEKLNILNNNTKNRSKHVNDVIDYQVIFHSALQRELTFTKQCIGQFYYVSCI